MRTPVRKMPPWGMPYFHDFETVADVEKMFPNYFFALEPGFHCHPALEQRARELLGEGAKIWVHNELVDIGAYWVAGDAYGERDVFLTVMDEGGKDG